MVKTDKDVPAEVLKLQITKLTELFVQTRPQSSGLKKLLIDILGTINHKIRRRYAHMKYVRDITGEYRSSRALKSQVNDKTSAEQLLHAIQESDSKNFGNRTRLRLQPKFLITTVSFFFYRTCFFVLRRLYRLVKASKLRTRVPR